MKHKPAEGHFKDKGMAMLTVQNMKARLIQ